MYNNGKGRQGKLQLHNQESNKEFEIFTEVFIKHSQQYYCIKINKIKKYSFTTIF